MEKGKRSFLILLGILLLLFVAAIFYVTASTRNIVPFAIDPDQVLREVLKKDNRISPIKAAKIIVDKDSSFVLVDVRSQYEYSKGHLPDAINIFKANVLEKNNLDFFKKINNNNKKALIYGNNAVEANAPFMILQQVGYTNVALLEGDYDFFEANDYKTIAEMGELDMDIDEAGFDFAKLIDKEKVKADIALREEQKKKERAKKNRVYTRKIHSTAKKISVKTNKKQSVPAKSDEAEDEEDEGC